MVLSPLSHLKIGKLRLQEFIACEFMASELQSCDSNLNHLIPSLLFFTFCHTKKTALILVLYYVSSFLLAYSFPQALRCCWPPTKLRAKAEAWPNFPEQRFPSWSTPPHSHILICTERIVFQGHLCSNPCFRVHLYTEKTVCGICKLQLSISLFHHWLFF